MNMVQISFAGRSRRAQRGVAAPLLGVMLLALVVSGVSVVEIGRFYYTQRELQRVADLAAMDAVRVASGCRGGIPDVMSANSATMDAQVRSAALASIQQNQGGANSLAPLNGLATVTTAGRSINDIDDPNAANAFRYFNPPLVTRPTADAVRVDLTVPQPAMLTSLLSNTRRVMHASATARQINVGSWQVRNSQVQLNTADGFLGPMLGIANLNVGVLGYQSLLNASLPAASVAAALGVSNPQGVGAGALASVNLPLGTALNNLSNQLLANGQAAAAAVFSSLATAAQGSNGTVNAAGVFSQTLTAISPAASLNAYDLLNSLAEDVTSAYPIKLPVTATILGGVTGGAFVFLNGPQQAGFGPPGLDGSGQPLDPANAQLSSTSAGVIKVRLSVADSGILKSALGLLSALGVVTVNAVNLGIDIQFSAATGGLQQLTCPSASSLAYNYVLRTQTQPITVTVGTFSGAIPSNPNTPAQVPGLSGGPLVSITLLPLLGKGITATVAQLSSAASVTAGGGSSQTNTISVPVPLQAGVLGVPVAAGSNSLDLLSTLTSSLNTLLGSKLQILPVLGISVPLQSLTSSLISLLDPVLQPVDQKLLGPVLAGLGLGLGNATEEVDSLPATPSGQPPIVVTSRTDSNDQFY